MSSGNLLKSLFGSFFGGADPEAAKKKALKNIAKSLSKTKYRFYKSSSHEVEPAFAKFFYEIYKAVSPSQSMIQSINPNMYKRMVIDHCLSEKQAETLASLSEESIQESARGKSLKEVNETVKKTLESFSAEFDANKISFIDMTYTNLSRFASFVQFDFYFMLKKFDNGMKEHNFSRDVKFLPINGSYILEDLKNFIDASYALPLDASWDEVFKLFKKIKGVDPVPAGVWKKILARIKYLRDNRILEMMIQLISDNPDYRQDVAAKDLYIADDFISEVKKTAENAVIQLKEKQTAGKVEGLLNQIFGTSDIEGLKFYNEANCAAYERKDLGSYEYCEPLGYLKKFIIEYVKKDIKELSDILLVRGKWDNQQLATPMSEAFHQLLEISDKIIALDNSLSDTVDLGLKMKTHLPRTERDKESRNIISSTITFINDSAAQLIIDATKLFISYDRNLKMILEDCVKQRPTLIRNWKEIDHFADEKLRQMCVDAYKQIFAFVSLLQNFPVEIREQG
jgi:hypothetical protein